MLGRVLVVMLLAWCAAASAASPAPILVLGDSLSAAYRLPTSEGWVALLERRLVDNNLQRPVVNASISGETTAGGLARLPALLAEHKPALVVVELGANDALRGLPLAQVRANLTQTLTAIRAAGARAVLLGIEMPPNYGTPYRDGLRAMYRDLAAEFNAPLLPFLLDGVAQDPALMQGDGLHPTAAGQPKVLDNVWPVLAPALKALPAAATKH